MNIQAAKIRLFSSLISLLFNVAAIFIGVLPGMAATESKKPDWMGKNVELLLII